MWIDYQGLKDEICKLTVKKKPITFLEILGKTDREVLVSKYLAFLLDEKNTSRKLIKEILEATAVDEEVDFVDLLDVGVLESVKTEDAISQDSRLDIIIKYSTFWIVIENKIWASESKQNQTIAYEKKLKSQNKENLPIKFIYLKPNFNKSKPSNKHFVELTYGKLADILQSVSYEEVQDKECFVYLQDFIKHSKEYFMKDNQTIVDEQALEFYFAHKKEIDYIVDTYKKQSIIVRDRLMDELKEAYPAFNVHVAASYMQIYKDTWPNNAKTGIHFQLNPTNTNFDSLLKNRVLKIRYAVHNEQSTKEKYPEVVHRSLYTIEYMFDNNENIQKSIHSIVEEVGGIICKHEKEIDDVISSK